MDNKGKTDFFQPLRHWGPASLVSLLIHALALYLIVMLPPLSPPVKRVVQVEAITMTVATPKPEGGHAGGSGGPPPAPEPQTVPKPPPPPKPVVAPKPKPKPVVRPPVERPEPEPIPPPLAMPRPVPKVVAPPSPAAGSSARSYSSSYGSSIGRGSGIGSGAGVGSGSGAGVGSGRGSGTGSGTGTGSGSGSGAALQGYLAKVRSLLERKKVYPSQARSRNEQGTAVVRFTISSNGSIGGVGLSKSSGNSTLDQAAQETVHRVGQFPPFPSDLQRSSLTVQVPLAFRLQGG